MEHGQPARRLSFTMATVNDTPPAVSTIDDPGMPPLAAIDGKLKTAWGIRFGEARNPFIALRFAEAVQTTENTTIVVTLRHESELRRAVIGRFRLASPPTLRLASGGRLREAARSRASQWPDDLGRVAFPKT